MINPAMATEPETSDWHQEQAQKHAHERTLLGAIDSYLSQLVHVRPFLITGYRRVLDHMAERWLTEGGENQLAALTAVWINLHIDSAKRVSEQQLRRETIDDLLAWARREGLTTTRR